MTDVGVEKKSRGRVCKTGGGEGKGGYIKGSRGGGTVNVEEEEGGCKSERGGGGGGNKGKRSRRRESTFCRLAESDPASST